MFSGWTARPPSLPPALRVLRSEANDPQSVRPASGYAILPIPLAPTCHSPVANRLLRVVFSTLTESVGVMYNAAVVATEW